MDFSHLAAITIDVDSLACYRAIHGLPFSRASTGDPCFNIALPRFASLCEEVGAKGTLFVVGDDLGIGSHVDIIRRLDQDGHEIASHSFAHDYRMSTWSRAHIDEDLARAENAIAETTGHKPVGFRAPGYNQSDTLFDVLEARGYEYDSSFFPTPIYFAARAAAIAAYRLRGRPSRSLIGHLGEFTAPLSPFFPSRTKRFRPANKGQTPRTLLEIPMTAPLAMPWLGTTLATLPRGAGEGLTAAATLMPRPVVLELHAIDLLDPDEIDDQNLLAAQPDTRVRWVVKRRRLRRTLRWLAKRRQVRPLRQWRNLAVRP